MMDNKKEGKGKKFDVDYKTMAKEGFGDDINEDEEMLLFEMTGMQPDEEKKPKSKKKFKK